MFTAHATDPDGDIVRVSWSVDGRTERQGFIGNKEYATDSFSHTFHQTGRHRVEAAFKDSWGQAHSVAWEVEVADQVPAPLSIATIGCRGSQVSVHEIVSCHPDVEGSGALQYLWTAYDGLPATGASRVFSTSWDTQGHKEVALEICDTSGCVSARQTIVVNAVTLGTETLSIEIVDPLNRVQSPLAYRKNSRLTSINPAGILVWVTWLVDNVGVVFEPPFAGNARKTVYAQF